MSLLRPAPGGPTADVSVRPAVPGDEGAVAAVQLAAWRSSHAAVLGTDVLDRLDPDAMAAQWAAAITAPPDRGHRVLVACAGPLVVGLASLALVPGDPPGGVLLALEVAPDHRRAGHGSRLLAAAVDLLRTDGADQLHTWVLDDDPVREQFLAAAGLGTDGGHRTLGTGPGPDGTERTVAEHRWSAAI